MFLVDTDGNDFSNKKNGTSEDCYYLDGEINIGNIDLNSTLDLSRFLKGYIKLPIHIQGNIDTENGQPIKLRVHHSEDDRFGILYRMIMKLKESTTDDSPTNVLPADDRKLVVAENILWMKVNYKTFDSCTLDVIFYTNRRNPLGGKHMFFTLEFNDKICNRYLKEILKSNQSNIINLLFETENNNCNELQGKILNMVQDYKNTKDQFATRLLEIVKNKEGGNNGGKKED
jgi:hypothetical protein